MSERAREREREGGRERESHAGRGRKKEEKKAGVGVRKKKRQRQRDGNGWERGKLNRQPRCVGKGQVRQVKQQGVWVVRWAWTGGPGRRLN